MSSGINQIIRTLSNPQNPIYISILIVLFIWAIVYFVYKYGIDPAYEIFKKEKENLELKSAKLMAQFAELDPDPVIRIDPSGHILETNQAAKNVFMDENIKGKNIIEVLPELNFQARNHIISETKTSTHKIGMRYYSILYRGDKELQIAQLYFRDTTEAKEYEEKLLNYQTRLKTLSESLQDLIEQERRKIARGLHDGIGQNLSFLRIKFLRMKDKADNDTSIFIQDSVESIEDIIQELKNISHSLKPRTLEEMGLQIAIKNMIDKVREETEIYGELNMSDEDIRFDEKIEINLYRIVQEALNNLVKYSGASNFSVQLVNSSKLIRLIITDNGIGFEVTEVLSGKLNKKGMGLLNIKERVESLCGILKIDSSPGNGTMLVVEIPVKEKYLWHSQNQYVF